MAWRARARRAGRRARARMDGRTGGEWHATRGGAHCARARGGGVASYHTTARHHHRALRLTTRAPHTHTHLSHCSAHTLHTHTRTARFFAHITYPHRALPRAATRAHLCTHAHTARKFFFSSRASFACLFYRILRRKSSGGVIRRQRGYQTWEGRTSQ